MSLSLIVARAANGVIGKDNRLPWHLPEDLRYFKQTTLGKAMIMGRKTFESIGRPLPGRRSIIVTRNRDWRHDGVETAANLEQARLLAQHPAPDGEIFVIGGAGLFAEALPLADRLHLTEIHRDYDGDVFFPPWQESEWREIGRRRAEGDPPCSFVLYERV